MRCCAGTELAVQAGTIRAKLLKVGAVIVRNTRRTRFYIAILRHLFLAAAHCLSSG